MQWLLLSGKFVHKANEISHHHLYVHVYSLSCNQLDIFDYYAKIPRSPLYNISIRPALIKMQINSYKYENYNLSHNTVCNLFIKHSSI